tara:strand:- start:1886 stop:2632 length:747 start_codon:yes stop_codon:yes gene_type:complete
MLYLVGNGPSRKTLDLDTLDNWWGMNMVYRDHTPDLLFVQDVAPQNEMITDQYYKKHPVCVGEWNELPMDMFDIMKFGLPGEVIENRVEGDDRFVVQGEDYRGEGQRTYMIGYSSAEANNIVIYTNELLKNTFCGIYALGYAVHHGHKKICLAGYDSLQYGDLQNIYGPKDCYTYNETYTEQNSGVGKPQQAQFVALLEHINKDYPDVELYFKNSIDGFDKIEYTDIVSRLNIEDRWILGTACFESEL